MTYSHSGLVTRATVAAGHEIGVHGYEHRLLRKRGPWSTRRDLTRAVDTIASVTGVTPRWSRPPSGVATTAALREARRLGLRPVPSEAIRAAALVAPVR